MSAIIRFRFRRLFIACLPALIVASSACAAERGLERVRIAVSSKSLGFLDTWAARERGFYRKHGVDAEIIAMRGPSPGRSGPCSISKANRICRSIASSTRRSSKKCCANGDSDVWK
jgi:hypothetical protein